MVIGLSQVGLLTEKKNNNWPVQVSTLVSWTGEPLTLMFLKMWLLSISDSCELSISVSYGHM